MTARQSNYFEASLRDEFTHLVNQVIDQVVERLAAQAIETNESFSREDPLQELGRLELKALGRVKHGDVPPATEE